MLSTCRAAGVALVVTSLFSGCARCPPCPERPAGYQSLPDLNRKPSKQDRFQIPGKQESLLTDDVGVCQAAAPLTLCSWNIKWFGSKTASAYDFVTMADFMEECDVVAIQELQDPHATDVLNTLLAELTARGLDFRKRLSPNTGYNHNTDPTKHDYLERYAFLWNNNRVNQQGEPSFISGSPENHPVFRQVPWVDTFKVVNGHGFDFRILSVHTVYNAGLNAVRRKEIEAIRDWITTMPPDSEENLIAIGDFNANPPSQPSHFASVIVSDPLYRVLWYESAASGEDSIRTTVPTKDTSSNPDYLRLPIYDHALLSFETSPALPANPMTLAGEDFGVYQFDNDPWWKQHGWTRRDIIAAVSDHRPLWVKLDFNAPDQD